MSTLRNQSTDSFEDYLADRSSLPVFLDRLQGTL